MSDEFTKIYIYTGLYLLGSISPGNSVSFYMNGIYHSLLILLNYQLFGPVRPPKETLNRCHRLFLIQKFSLSHIILCKSFFPRHILNLYIIVKFQEILIQVSNYSNHLRLTHAKSTRYSEVLVDFNSDCLTYHEVNPGYIKTNPVLIPLLDLMSFEKRLETGIMCIF